MLYETESCPPSPTANDAMIVAVNWLSKVYVHLDDFCRGTGGDTSLGHLSPYYFLLDSVPLECTYDFRTWFIDLWNQKLVRYWTCRLS